MFNTNKGCTGNTVRKRLLSRGNTFLLYKFMTTTKSTFMCLCHFSSPCPRVCNKCDKYFRTENITVLTLEGNKSYYCKDCFNKKIEEIDDRKDDKNMGV